MKLVINTAGMRFGGAVQGAISFIYECKNSPQNEYHVFVGSGVAKTLKAEEFPSNFYFYYFNWTKLKIRQISKRATTLSQFEAKIKPDCIITTSGPPYWRSKSPHIVGYNLGLYIYPESPYFTLIPTKTKIKIFLRKKLHIYYFKRDADYYFVQTDDVNKRVRKLLETDKVETISNTCNIFFRSNYAKIKKLPPKFEGERRFLLLSSYYLHKNIEIIGNIVEILKENEVTNIRFVVTLAESRYETIFTPEQCKYIYNTGFVKSEELPALYEECDFMFLPTLSECFSASYPEAMVMKKPIITTDLGFARSICQDAAVYFKPLNAKDAYEKVVMLANNQSLCNKLINAGLKQLENFETSFTRAEKILKLAEKVSINI